MYINDEGFYCHEEGDLVMMDAPTNVAQMAALESEIKSTVVYIQARRPEIEQPTPVPVGRQIRFAPANTYVKATLFVRPLNA